MKARLAAGLLLLAALTVDATLVIQQTVTTTPSAVIPVVLTSGGNPTTTPGTSGTSAVTTGADLPLTGSITTLQINRGTGAWSVQLRVTGASGVGLGEAATVALVGGTTEALVLTPSTSYPVMTSAVTLPSAGPDIVVTAAGLLCTCTFTMQLLLFPPGATSPALTYSYTLTTV